MNKTDKKMEVPKTRDEINNALLESEIYKVAYQKGVEDGVRGFVDYYAENANHLGEFDMVKQVDKYLQSLDKGDGE